MRPVLLDMHGFAAFREPTTVDFTDAEYFALVGPTGAGKSTVIDAMTFALYGSVPRWDDRRTVALALSPTANRGTVRLIFDVGDQRYVVARELRRAANGSVTVRNARLERFLDPAAARSAAAAAEDVDTEVIAHDGAVSKAVEDLLGLPFEQFCICVVLPQGDFAQFLHAKPADRQRTLTRILGLSMYETMAREAGNEARLAAQREALLTEQLGEYADATEEAIAAAAKKEEELAELVARVADTQPVLAEAEAQVAEAEQTTRRLTEERSRLAELRAPDGLAELAQRARESAATVAEAKIRLAEAEADDTAARERLAAAPPKEPLLRVRQNRAELAELTERYPDLVEAWERAKRATEAAGKAAAEADAALESARQRRDAAEATVSQLRADAARLTEERTLLSGVSVPDGVPQLAADRRAAAEAVAQARRDLAAAERADTEARAALAAGPDRALLDRARRDHEELAAAERQRPELTARYEAAAARVATADAELAAAQRAVDAAHQERDAALRTDVVAALRPGLTPHQPCPVCEQRVYVLPPPLEAADLAAADAAVAAATEERDRWLAEQRAAVSAEHRAAAELDALLDRINALREALAGAPASLERVDQLLAESARLAEAASEADAAVRRARQERDRAEAKEAEVAERMAASVAELRAARDPLVALGAPEIDQLGGEATGEGLVASWQALAAWAVEAAAERGTALAEVERRLAEAAEELRRAEQARQERAEQAEHRQREHTEAVRAEQDAHGELTRAHSRREELAAALAGAPDEAQVARELAELEELDNAARAADAELRAARAQLREAQRSAEEVRAQVEAGWRRLRAARDPLVGLGAPVLDAPSDAVDPDDPDDPDEENDDPDGPGDHLVAAWHALVGWAGRAIADRDRRLATAERELAEARAKKNEIQRALVAELAAHDIELPDGQPPHTAAPSAASAALERAKAAHARLAERRASASRLLADRAEAQESARVAKMLAGLLRSDAFPRWLVSSALDALVADASAKLAELSGGQFELAHEDGEFVVIDHADADARRPVKTLSGGETFQASLALALALSEQLSSLASAGAARLDSIFLDEGFGTLDEANLEVVAGTLENLASLGERMVGVVTHVPALAERVPVRFTVSRDQRSATVVRETP